MVAVGDLEKIWMDTPQDVPEEEFSEAFKGFFGIEWKKVLDAVDKSYAYNAFNTVYFSVGNIKSLDNINLDTLLEDIKKQPPNVVVS